MEIDERYYGYAMAQMDRAEREERKYNGYKDKADRTCFYTGTPYAERHEVFGGTANRKISLSLGFQVDLCPEKHLEIQMRTTPWGKSENDKWRTHFQRAYMDRIKEEGITEEEALRAWVMLIGRNYIMDLMPQ